MFILTWTSIPLLNIFFTLKRNPESVSKQPLPVHSPPPPAPTNQSTCTPGMFYSGNLIQMEPDDIQQSESSSFCLPSPLGGRISIQYRADEGVLHLASFIHPNVCQVCSHPSMKQDFNPFRGCLETLHFVGPSADGQRWLHPHVSYSDCQEHSHESLCLDTCFQSDGIYTSKPCSSDAVVSFLRSCQSVFASACLIYMFVSFSNVGGFYFSTSWPPFTVDSHLYFF